MDLQRKLTEFISRQQITAWLLIIMGAGLLLQVLIWIVIAIVGGEDSLNLYRQVVSYFMIPSSGKTFIFQPWSVLTYPLFSASPVFAAKVEESGLVFNEFAFSFFRLLIDGLLIWTFTRLHRQMLGEDRTKRMAILGIPLIGLLTLIISSIIGPGEGLNFLSGMTCIMIMFAVSLATFIPKYPIPLFLFGRVPLVWIVVVLVLLDIIGGLGITPVAISVMLGAIFGFLNVYLMRKGTDVTQEIWAFYQAKESNDRKVRVTPTPQSRKRETREAAPAANGEVTQETIDQILDKISEKGYDSLSRQEKEILLRASGTDRDEKA